jgi:alpha-1,2-mannosyltransferase
MIDSWAYGKWTFPSLNIVSYNLFSRFGPDLYGTEPASFYILNLFLNFNFLSLAALASLPALLVTYKFDFRRLGKTQMKPKDGEASPYTLLATRLAPFYIWLGILTAQAHKEERFMFPIYPLLCFNASVTIFLIRGWFETAFIKVTSSPYRASKSSLFSTFAALAVLVPALISVGRSVGLFHFYHAPLDIAHHFEYQTAPGILAELGYEATPFPRDYHPRDGELPEWDLSPLKTLDPPVRICYGAEWHRYPPSYLIPEGVETAIIRSDFTGMMPRKWEPSGPVGRWPRQETRVIHPGRFNGANQASAEPGAYADISTCTYLVALHSPSQKPTKLEPDYVHSDEWERDFCAPFLDNPASKWWSRLIWLPGGIGENGRVYGEYCLLRRKSITTSE